MTDAHVGTTDNSPADLKSATSGQVQTGSHSELFGLEGQKRASTTTGAGAGSGIIGTSGHVGAARGDNAQNAGRGGQGGVVETTQGTGDVQSLGEATGEKKLKDKLNPFK